MLDINSENSPIDGILNIIMKLNGIWKLEFAVRKEKYIVGMYRSMKSQYSKPMVYSKEIKLSSF